MQCCLFFIHGFALLQPLSLHPPHFFINCDHPMHVHGIIRNSSLRPCILCNQQQMACTHRNVGKCRLCRCHFYFFIYVALARICRIAFLFFHIFISLFYLHLWICIAWCSYSFTEITYSMGMGFFLFRLLYHNEKVNEKSSFTFFTQFLLLASIFRSYLDIFVLCFYKWSYFHIVQHNQIGL